MLLLRETRVLSVVELLPGVAAVAAGVYCYLVVS